MAAEEAAESAAEHQPINFGKRLAHTDKLVRDRGFKTLKKWLLKNQDLSRLDFMKLWKGLYFGMWMADKRHVQQDLAVNVAMLLNDVPRDKQGMWMDCFWETMQDAWEKLDIHRISKYLLFVRIVTAEAFKVARVAGWQCDEMRSLGNSFTRAMPMTASQGPNAPSLGLLLQFTRLVWEEMRPQLEKGPTPKKAVLAFFEPFCLLAEGCVLDSLTRHIHEYILRGAPREFTEAFSARILDGAAKPHVLKKNRQALYDTADALDKIARSPAPEGVKVLRLFEGSPKASKSPKAKKSPALPPLELPPTSKPLTEAGERKKKKRKAKKVRTQNGGVSPLLLPQAMLPVRASHETDEVVGKVKWVKAKKSAPAATGNVEAPVVARPKKKRRL